MTKGRILVVDDDAFSRTICSDILTEGGFSVKTASNGPEALATVDSEPIDIVITDLVMPGMGGLEVLEKVKQQNALVDVLVVTGHGSVESAIKALKNGAFDYIRKPIDEDELLLTVNNCMEKKKLLEENQEMKQSLRLFELTRAVATTLDINKLYNITLDAFLQILPGEFGILVFAEGDGEERSLEIKSIRHLGIEEGERLVGSIRSDLAGEFARVGKITIFPVSEFKPLAADPALKDINSVVLVPFTRDRSALGYILIFSPLRRDAYGEADLKNADFVAEHASQAFVNALKYVEAKEMAFIDSLTNLYNNKYLDMALDRELKRADRLKMPVTVLFLDLDDFKQINDRNDHLVGSKVLVEVGGILLKCVREVDTVIRYGGDEYVVILVDADAKASFMVADRIRASIEKNRFMESEGLDIRVTVSIGLATYPENAKDKRELLKMADKAMYKAKNISKNLVYQAPVPG